MERRRPGQGPNGLIYVVNSNDGNEVVDAQEELNNMIEDGMRDTVVLAFANTTGAMTSPVSATTGPSGGVAAGLGVALPSASARRSRLLPEVFDDCSYGRRLSLRDQAIERFRSDFLAVWQCWLF